MKVLILVVVEDVLVHIRLAFGENVQLSLNPCCSGRCSSTNGDIRHSAMSAVLILVVVEDVLVPTGIKFTFTDDTSVLILVVVEDVLVLLMQLLNNEIARVS